MPAVREGDALTCARLTDFFGITAADMRGFDVLGVALNSHENRLDVCKFLVQRFGVRAEHHSFAHAVSRGHVSVCQWLVDAFPWFKHTCFTRVALFTAAHHGHLAVCKWIATTFFNKQGRSDVKYALRIAAAGLSCLETCTYLVTHFGLTAANAQRSAQLAVQWARTSKFGTTEEKDAVCSWLAAHFQLD